MAQCPAGCPENISEQSRRSKEEKLNGPSYIRQLAHRNRSRGAPLGVRKASGRWESATATLLATQQAGCKAGHLAAGTGPTSRVPRVWAARETKKTRSAGAKPRSGLRDISRKSGDFPPANSTLYPSLENGVPPYRATTSLPRRLYYICSQAGASRLGRC